jgi:hypothetical protein
LAHSLLSPFRQNPEQFLLLLQEKVDPLVKLSLRNSKLMKQVSDKTPDILSKLIVSLDLLSDFANHKDGALSLTHDKSFLSGREILRCDPDR